MNWEPHLIQCVTHQHWTPCAPLADPKKEPAPIWVRIVGFAFILPIAATVLGLLVKAALWAWGLT